MVSLNIHIGKEQLHSRHFQCIIYFLILFSVIACLKVSLWSFHNFAPCYWNVDDFRPWVFVHFSCTRHLSLGPCLIFLEFSYKQCRHMILQQNLSGIIPSSASSNWVLSATTKRTKACNVHMLLLYKLYQCVKQVVDL